MSSRQLDKRSKTAFGIEHLYIDGTTMRVEHYGSIYIRCDGKNTLLIYTTGSFSIRSVGIARFVSCDGSQS